MIDSTPMTMLLAKQGTARLAHSARPDAPVVEERRTRRRASVGTTRPSLTARTRASVARALHRVADAVGPTPHVPAH